MAHGEGHFKIPPEIIWNFIEMLREMIQYKKEHYIICYI